ncbi:uncharacterized protein [Bos indicus]|uniref:Uncharacterized protein n=1 Tax=Bos indicus TaxID=9915 RepID=A0A6P5BVF4_BOSIN
MKAPICGWSPVASYSESCCQSGFQTHHTAFPSALGDPSVEKGKAGFFFIFQLKKVPSAKTGQFSVDTKPNSSSVKNRSRILRSGRTQLCLELYLFPGPLCPSPSAYLRTIRWLHHPFPTSRPSLACVLLSNQACGEGRRPRFRPRCPHVLSRPPLPPCVVGQPSLFLFPIATEAAWAPALPVPAPRRPLHSHFLSPGAGAPEARPGPAVPAPGRVHQVLSQPLGSATTGQDVQASTSLPGLHPSARLAG